jgi:hypothetical protein
MKRTFILTSLAALTTASLVTSHTEVSGAPEFNWSQPTYPEVVTSGRIQLASDEYRIDAGDSTDKARVHDYGSG